LFRRLLPVLAFTNQEIATSIAFFKRLLVRRGVFAHETMRDPGFTWDDHNTRIADELIDLYLQLEAEVA
jgi:4-hydroxy-tetrahydrodipicolinate synthase